MYPRHLKRIAVNWDRLYLNRVAAVYDPGLPLMKINLIDPWYIGFDN